MLLETGQRERSNHLHKIFVEAPVLPDSDADCVFLHILESEGARTPECVKKRSLCIEKSKCTHGSRCKIHKLKGLKEPLVFLCTYADCADYIFCVFQVSPITTKNHADAWFYYLFIVHVRGPRRWSKTLFFNCV